MILNSNKNIAVDAGSVVSASVAESQSYVISFGINEISNYARWGDDLIVELSSGQTVRINNFFINGPAFHGLVLVDNGRQVQVDFSHAIVNSDDGIADSRVLYQPANASISVTKLLGILGGVAAGTAGAAAIISNKDDGSGADNNRLQKPAVAAKNDNDPHSDPVLIANEGYTNDSTPILDGEGAVPGGRIIIRINDGKPVFVTVNKDGTWNYTLPELPDGEYEVRISQRDNSGHVSDETSFRFTVDTEAPDVPVLEKAEDYVTPDAPVLGEDGKWSQAPGHGEIKAGGITNDAMPTFSGTGEPGSTIRIYDGDKVVGEGVVDKNGNWSVGLKDVLSDGHHDLHITATDKAGNESGKSPDFPIEIDTKLPGQLDLRNIELYENPDEFPDAGPIEKDKDGNWVTDSLRPVFRGRVGDIDAVWVEIIDGNSKVVAIVKVENGEWNWQPDQDLTAGYRNYQFRAVDAAGNRGPVVKSPSINIGDRLEAILEEHTSMHDSHHSVDNGQYSSSSDKHHPGNTDGKGNTASEQFDANVFADHKYNISDMHNAGLLRGHYDGLHEMADDRTQVAGTEKQTGSAFVEIHNATDAASDGAEGRGLQEIHVISGRDEQIHDGDKGQGGEHTDAVFHGQDSGIEPVELSDLFHSGSQMGEAPSVSALDLLSAEMPSVPLNGDSDLDMAAVYQQLIV